MARTRSRARTSGDTIQVQGLTDLQRALKRTEDNLQPAIRLGLRGIGNQVRVRAQANVPHETGRHGDDGPIRVKASATSQGVSVYAMAPHSRVQDRGGVVGGGAVIERARASGYMSRAVASSKPLVEAELQTILDTIEKEFGRK